MYVHLNTFIQLVSNKDYLNIWLWVRLAGYSLGLNSNNQNKTNNQSFLGRQCQARSLACSWGWPPQTPSSSPPPSSCSVGIFNLLSSCVVGIFNLWEKTCPSSCLVSSIPENLKLSLIFVDLWRFYKSLSYFANNGPMSMLFSTLSLLVAKCFVEGCNKRR